MSKLKIESGVSRVKHVKLQTSIDQAIADDIALMSQWSDNHHNYIVNELLRFAIEQAEDFQKYKLQHTQDLSASGTVKVGTRKGNSHLRETTAETDASASGENPHPHS